MQKKFNIREERLKLGLTQEVLAKSLEITPEYLSMLENGRKPISEKVLKKFNAAYLNSAAPPISDDSTAPPPQNPPEQKPPSAEDMELLNHLYALDDEALQIYESARKSRDYTGQIVPSLVLNLISLLRQCDTYIDELGKITTLLHLLNSAKAGERSQIDAAKTLLDKM